ncbi:hypothetical protein MPLSOD_410075 [Mesorhizobium sp. SOD10]|nr:hypothetical protein MPLSOD_410075 [Mesorhizobium sp. SOD10]
MIWASPGWVIWQLASENYRSVVVAALCGLASAADLRRAIFVSGNYDDGRVVWFVIEVLRAGAAGEGGSLPIALTAHLDDGGVVHEAVYGRPIRRSKVRLTPSGTAASPNCRS